MFLDRLPMLKGRTFSRKETSACGRTLRPKAISAEAAGRQRNNQRRTETLRTRRKTQGGGDLHTMATKKKAKKPAKKAAKKKK
jgi:hypothetical protein